jgi:hypothetical protein
VHIHGLADVTYEYNFNRPNTSGGSKGGPNATAPGGRVNQSRVFDTNASGWDLGQFNLHVDKSADGGVGFVSDINFGQVANVLRASTRNSNINPLTTSNDIVDITQAYLTYTAPLGTGINLSLGRFVTLLGEEVIPVYNNLNFNESRDFISASVSRLPTPGCAHSILSTTRWASPSGLTTAGTISATTTTVRRSRDSFH